ncbi:MAG: GyrI-like domain-containing protein [Leptospiraceae bacterium]|nr:GyrI-like domain-containing protein [Leptospiraceae bacterium]
MKKKIIVLFVLVLAGLLILAGVGYGYMGGFRAVEVEEGSFGPHIMIFATHRGPYENLQSSWDDFQKSYEEAGLKKCHSLSVYLDAPDTPPEELRTIIGCAIDDLSDAERANLARRFPVFHIPAMDAMVSEFPFRNGLSFMLGAMKVYPEFQRVMQERNFQPAVAFEVYGDADNIQKIEFVMPISEPRETFAPLEAAFSGNGP